MSLNVNAIRGSFEKVKPVAKEAADKFYELFFIDYPEAKVLFSDVNMEKQKAALMNALTYVVDHLEDSEKLTTYLYKMGARHVGYNVSDEQYLWVGKTLLKTFEYFFGNEWTPYLENEWIKAYNVVATLMQEGAREVSRKKPASNVFEFPKSSGASMQIRLPESLKTKIREQIRAIIWESVENEVKTIIQEELESFAQSDFLKKVVNN